MANVNGAFSSSTEGKNISVTAGSVSAFIASLLIIREVSKFNAVFTPSVKQMLRYSCEFTHRVICVYPTTICTFSVGRLRQ